MREISLAIKLSWLRLNSRGKVVLIVYGLSLILTAGLDGAAIIFMARLANKVNDVNETTLRQAIPIALLCVGLFLIKSILSAAITWAGFKNFAQQEVRIGTVNFEKYLEIDPGKISKEQLSDIYSFVDRGPHAMVQGLLMTSMTAFAEVANAAILFCVLLSLDWVTALSVAIFFLFVAILQHKILSVTASRAGQVVVEELDRTYNILSDAFALNKLLRIMKSQSLERQLAESRSSLAIARAKVTFLESLPRYFMESMLAIALVVIGATTLLVRGVDGLAPAVTVFGAAGFRLLPIVNRVQGIILGLMGREPLARLGLREIERVSVERSISNHLDSEVMLELQNVTYAYPAAQHPAINDVSFTFVKGKQYAIVGRSGSGKTTLVDLCMGILQPTSGTVQWATESDKRLAYVPQDTTLISTDLMRNVAIEWDSESVNFEVGLDSLQKSSLNSIIEDARFADSGLLSGLSGGQRQRMGVARALYRDPKVIFLDEPTSALDSETEFEIMSLISNLRGEATVIIVAHRLSTIHNADIVIFVEEGTILGAGTFENLRQTIPSFNRQVELGLIAND
jgi:ABC-type multidrug transport system fused ATPase/permease subunit